jgi:FMN-dependent NADH-azoreductase/putative sterol carrier protein
VLAFVLTLVRYTDDYALQQILQNVIPIALLLLTGVPLTAKLPGLLMSKGATARTNFNSVKEMFQAMPFGLNIKKSEGVDAVIMFKLNGEEDIEGYLTISNNECTYTEGKHAEPTTTIVADSKLWLDISNGDVSGDEAYINKRYAVEGDVGFLSKLNDLFTASVPEKKSKKQTKQAADGKYIYKTFEPNRIKKIIVVNASLRTDKFSKSLMMAKKFIAGAESAGAEVEMVILKDKTIHYCTCCYTCWTKTPGVCIHKDDMPELMEKVRKADLVVYVTPLYVFSISAQLKAFIDRMLPNMKPYMVKTDGLTHHPNRHEEDLPNGLIVFAAGGFPEVEKNFDGISAIVRNMSSHLATTNLMAEFFPPAAELLQQPVYRERKERIEETCYNAGRDAVLKGTISEEYMETVADPGIEQDVFMNQANMFWKSLDGKKSYNRAAPKLVQ